MKVKARLKNYRSSARKVREVSPIIKGLSVKEALWQLENLKKGCAEDLRKLLLSAIANATNNHAFEKENLFVSELVVQEGRVLKRWRPRAHGRATPILKRSCHVILTIETSEEVEREKQGTEKKRDEKKKEEKK
ncbi:MAG: 50S ribosomal protein L22 [Patescibacteria group bacterium]|nr:50S ribosomal protein L22 [Patescibacteria group bacterium]